MPLFDLIPIFILQKIVSFRELEKSSLPVKLPSGGRGSKYRIVNGGEESRRRNRRIQTYSLSLSLDKSRAARLGASELLKWRERFYLGATNKLAPFERAFRCDRGDRPPNFIVGNGAPSFCLSAIRHLPPPLPSQHRLTRRNYEITTRPRDGYIRVFRSGVINVTASSRRGTRAGSACTIMSAMTRPREKDGPGRETREALKRQRPRFVSSARQGRVPLELDFFSDRFLQRHFCLRFGQLLKRIERFEIRFRG